MEDKKIFKSDDIPYRYPMCNRNDCGLCKHCLRYRAYDEVGKSEKFIYIVNPLLIEPANCEYFRTDEPATYALGFTKMQQEMLPRQYNEFSARLRGRFGRTGFFDRRRGNRFCSPAEIETIKSVLKDLGLPELEFDSYLKKINWCD